SRLLPSHTTVPTGPYTAVRRIKRSRLAHERQTQTTKARFGEGAMQSLAEAEPPRTLWAEDGFARQPFGDLKAAQFAVSACRASSTGPRRRNAGVFGPSLRAMAPHATG